MQEATSAVIGLLFSLNIGGIPGEGITGKEYKTI
jgi:hypothetical protein